MLTFDDFITNKTPLNEKKLPPSVEDVIASLGDEDAQILDYKAKKSKGIETHSIFVKLNGEYEVYEVVDDEVSARKMDTAERNRYKTGND